MTIQTEIPKHILDGPYNIGDEIDLPFSYADPEDVKVLRQDTPLKYGDEGYTIVGKRVTLHVAVAANQTVTLYRETPLNNNTEYPQEAVFDSEKINDAIDKLTMQNQEQAEAIDRAIKLAINSNTNKTEITKVEGITPEANKCLKWNSDGTALGNSKYDPDASFEIAQRLYDDTSRDIQRVYDYVGNKASEFQSTLNQARIQLALAENAVKDAQNKVQTAANFSMPDWTNRSTRTKEVAYKAEENGWLYVCDNVADNKGWSNFSLQFSKDGSTWTSYPVKNIRPDTGRDNHSICAPIPKDHWYKVTRTSKSHALTLSAYYFVPCFGRDLATPESGGTTVDTYSKEEIDLMLDLKMDEVLVLDPLQIITTKHTADNLTVVGDNTVYLNKDAFTATYPENIKENLTQNHTVFCSNNVGELIFTCLAEPYQEGTLPKINLRGCNCFLRTFKYGDIIMSDDMPLDLTNGINDRNYSFVLGTIYPDGSFMPKIHVDSSYYPIDGQYRVSFKMGQVKKLEQVSFTEPTETETGQVRITYPLHENDGELEDSEYCKFLAHWSYTTNELNPVVGIYLRKFYRSENDSNPVLALEPIFADSDGKFSFEDYVTEYVPLDTSLESLDINCVIYDSIAFNSYSTTDIAEGSLFTLNAYYVAHDTLDNKVATLGQTSEASYLQVKKAEVGKLGCVMPDGITITADSSGKISAVNAPQAFSSEAWANMTDEEKAAISFAMVYEEST